MRIGDVRTLPNSETGGESVAHPPGSWPCFGITLLKVDNPGCATREQNYNINPHSSSLARSWAHGRHIIVFNLSYPWEEAYPPLYTHLSYTQGDIPTIVHTSHTHREAYTRINTRYTHREA